MDYETIFGFGSPEDQINDISFFLKMDKQAYLFF